MAVLQAQGFSALALFGELEQRERDQVLVRFANRSCSVLVATDVAARGLDIANLEAVINVDVTPDSEVHVHRIGRTGRAGESGLALNLASMNEMGYVGKIEQLQGRESEWHPLAELTPASKEPLVPPMVTLHIQGGRKEKIRPGDVLGALTADLGYTREQVGKINVNEWSTYVAVDRDDRPAGRQPPRTRADQRQEREGSGAGRLMSFRTPLPACARNAWHAASSPFWPGVARAWRAAKAAACRPAIACVATSGRKAPMRVSASSWATSSPSSPATPAG